jgi:hypothetical protein
VLYTLTVPITCDLADAPRLIQFTVTGDWPSIAELGELLPTGTSIAIGVADANGVSVLSPRDNDWD